MGFGQFFTDVGSAITGGISNLFANPGLLLGPNVNPGAFDPRTGGVVGGTPGIVSPNFGQASLGALVPVAARAGGALLRQLPGVVGGAALGGLFGGGGGGAVMRVGGVRVDTDPFHTTPMGNVVPNRRWVQFNPETGRLHAFQEANIRITNKPTGRHRHHHYHRRSYHSGR